MMSVAQVLATALCLTVFSLSAAFAESSRLALEEAIDAAGVSFVEIKPVTHIETDGSEGKGLTITYSLPDNYVYDDQPLPKTMRTVAALTCIKHRQEHGIEAYETRIVVDFVRVLSSKPTSPIFVYPFFERRSGQTVTKSVAYPPHRHCVDFDAEMHEPLRRYLSVTARHFSKRLRSHHLSLKSIGLVDIASHLNWKGLDSGEVWFAGFEFSKEADSENLSQADIDEALELACRYIRGKFKPLIDPKDQTKKRNANLVNITESSGSIRSVYFFAHDASCAVDYNKWPVFQQINKRHDPND